MLNQPSWIVEDLTPYDIAAINQGGCASGAYMPAVTYHDASVTMGEYGDEVLEFIENHLDEIIVPSGLSWSGMACWYLSTAVELWCLSQESIEDWENDTSDVECAA